MAKKKTHLINLILVILTIFMGGMPYPGRAFEIKAKHITMADGLSNNTVRYLYQDSKGFMWLATANGLNRYDGHNFKLLLPTNDNRLSLADRRVISMKEDHNGFLWIKMTPNKISCYDLANDRFTDFTGCGQYKTPYRDWIFTGNDTWMWGEAGCRRVTYRNGKFSSEVFSARNGQLAGDNIRQITTNGQNVWITGNKGLYLWKNGRLHTVSRQMSFKWSATDGVRNWFAATDGSIWQYNGKLVKVGQIPDINGTDELCGQLYTSGKWYLFTTSGGFVFDTDSRKTTAVRGELNIPAAEVITDNAGDYWLFNKTGILRYVSRSSGKIKAFRLMDEQKVKTLDQERYHIIQARNGLIWITTNGGGLYAYDPHEDHLYHYTADNTASAILQSNSQLCITEDRAGNIWTGTWMFGATQLNISGLKAYETPLYATVKGHVRMLEKDGNGLWIGDTDGHLYHADQTLKATDGSTTEGCNIYAIARDASGELWYGTRTKGLRIGKAWYTHIAGDRTSLGNNAVFDILRDRRNRMWIATFGGGLNLAEPDGKGGFRFRQFMTDNYGLKQVRCLCMDHNGWIWAGTSEGLLVFNPDRILKDPHSYIVYNWNNKQLNSNEIRSILCDSKGQMWIAETGSGFAVCRPGSDYSRLSFTHYTTENGLCNGMVQSFAEDHTGRIWIATAYGLSCFVPGGNTFRNFSFSSSMAGNVYSENCALTLDDGRLLFGTNDGIALLNPEEISNTGKPVHITFTNLTVNGVEPKPDETDYPLEKALPYSSEISLNHGQNSFIISFSTLEFPVSGQTLYSYKLDNYDTDWSSPTALDFASYKNMKPGTYTLHVKATDTEGIWSPNESTIRITVHPPFYATPLAYIFYVLLLAGIGCIVFRVLRKMDALRTQVKVEEQLADYKLVFFTNISHEFRTPLTLIQAAMERLNQVGNDEGERRDGMQLMNKSVARMLRLVNELLEFRKAEKGKLSLSLEKTDIIALLKEHFKAFRSPAKEKQMTYRFVTDLTDFTMPADRGKLDKIIYNLLSNAFKYTPDGGSITMSVGLDSIYNYLVIKIADTGVGIPKERQNRLFTRFATGNTSRHSIGIGLHLVFELVKALKGSISYEENTGGGSIFTVRLPANEKAYAPEDFLKTDNKLFTSELEEQKRRTVSEDEDSRADALMTGEGSDAQVEPSKPMNDRVILVIEDDRDVRSLLVSELSPYATVVARPDGQSGYDYARENDVDLILCDVMMPGIDGFEVTQRIKTRFETSHIPVVLLTALSADESRLKGIECGADSYITKPFSRKLLLTRIFKLIEQRDKLKEKFSSDITATRPLISLTDPDKTFAERLSDVIGKNLSNPDFTVDDFATAMSLGHTILYRKVKGVTGYAPKTYLRVMRMKKAAELLLQPDINISEVAYSVGLNDPLYFSKCFKQQFGVSPSVYKEHGGIPDKNKNGNSPA